VHWLSLLDHTAERFQVTSRFFDLTVRENTKLVGRRYTLPASPRACLTIALLTEKGPIGFRSSTWSHTTLIAIIMGTANNIPQHPAPEQEVLVKRIWNGLQFGCNVRTTPLPAAMVRFDGSD
jgi:hypothetical protein